MYKADPEGTAGLNEKCLEYKMELTQRTVIIDNYSPVFIASIHRLTMLEL